MLPYSTVTRDQDIVLNLTLSAYDLLTMLAYSTVTRDQYILTRG